MKIIIILRSYIMAQLHEAPAKAERGPSGADWAMG